MAPLTPSCFDCFPLPALSLPRFLPLSLPICFSFSDSLFLCLNGTSFLANRRHIHTSQQFSFPPQKKSQTTWVSRSTGFSHASSFWLSIFATLLPYPSPGAYCTIPMVVSQFRRSWQSDVGSKGRQVPREKNIFKGVKGAGFWSAFSSNFQDFAWATTTTFQNCIWFAHTNPQKNQDHWLLLNLLIAFRQWPKNLG